MSEAKIILPDMPELTFEEKCHVYRLNGQIIPSVTTLMKPIQEKVYGGVDPMILEKAANRGHAIHNATENFVQYGIEDIEPGYEGYLAGFIKWWEARKPKVVATERRVYHKVLRYAGTSDLLAIINGRLTLIDYKSSSQVYEKLCDVQLEGYDRAYESHGVKIEDRLILHLGRDGRYQEIPFYRNTKSWSVFSALMTIHNYMI